MNLCALSDWVATRYDKGWPVACRLVRSYTNDVYAVNARDAQFILKIYGQGWRSEAEIRYEASLLHHLAARGMRVPRPLAGSDHDVLQKLETDDRHRYVVLYEYAPGEKPHPPFSLHLYEAFGQTIARMHTLSDDFVTDHARRALDLNQLIDEPAALVAPLLQNSEDQEFLQALVALVKERMTVLAPQCLDWGPIHGDATLDNLHVTAQGEVVLYDFDSGGPGWRAADLQGWAAGSTLYQQKWRAFLRGYSRVRRLTEPNLRAAPLLTIAWDIWGLKIDLERRVLKQGPERVEAYLSQQVAMLRERERALRQN